MMKYDRSLGRQIPTLWVGPRPGGQLQIPTLSRCFSGVIYFIFVTVSSYQKIKSSLQHSVSKHCFLLGVCLAGSLIECIAWPSPQVVTQQSITKPNPKVFASFLFGICRHFSTVSKLVQYIGSVSKPVLPNVTVKERTSNFLPSLNTCSLDSMSGCFFIYLMLSPEVLFIYIQIILVSFGRIG